GRESIALSWPGSLPAPSVEGDSAVYHDVLPGVDLRLTASVQGYRELLVVKTPQAAANPRLERLQFGVKSDHLTVTALRDGGLTGVDYNGEQVFTAPPAQLWTSRGTGAESPVPAAPTAKSAAKSAAVSAVDGPAPGAGASRVPVSVSGESLVVAPDRGLLRQADAAAYPIYIDPDISLNTGLAERTLLRSDGYTSYGWDNGSDDRGKGDGKCGTWNNYYCGPGYVQKLFFEFSPILLRGKYVQRATFRVTSPWAFVCESRVTDLVRTNNISSSTTWGSRPKELDWMVDRSFSAGRGSTCDPDSPPAPIEFTDNSAEPDENLTATVRDFAVGKFARLTLELRAHDEGDSSAWKRYMNNAVLSVDFIGRPIPPTQTGIVEGTGVSCETNPADPDVIADPTPEIATRVRVASGGSSADKPARLRAYFNVQKQYSSGTWGLLAEPIRPMSGFAGDNELVSSPYPGTLTEGTNYRIAAATWSYDEDDSTNATHIGSNSTVTTAGWCYFKVDPTAPKAPKVTFGGPYSSCTSNACAAAGGPGQPGKFTFAPAAGDTVVGYQYKLGSGNWSSTISGSTINVTITPSLTGTMQLQVRARDNVGSGRWGAKTVVAFKVAPGVDAVGRWHFDDAEADSATLIAADTATGPSSRHPATLRNPSAGWSLLARRGDTDRSLWLNDTSDSSQQTGYADTSGPVVNTQYSYTVSAWVFLTDTSAYHTVLSQTNSDSSGFTLRYSPGIHRWVFQWAWTQNGARQFLGVNGTTEVGTSTWTHLAATYDATAHTISLYVNGKRQGGPVQLPTASAATVNNGALQFGRASYTPGSYVEYWKGRIDEVQAWQRILTDDEIALDARLLDANGKPAVENIVTWEPDPLATGTTLANTASYSRTLTLSGGAGFDDGAMTFDGVDDKAVAPGPLVDDTGSFTVTARVQPDQAKVLAHPDGYTVQVAGQRTATGSSWGLWYQLTGRTTAVDDDHNEITVPTARWLFGRIDAAGNFSGAASAVEVASSNSGDTSNGEGVVRVTGVYDAQSGTAALYLGDNPQDEQPYTGVVGTGEFTVAAAYVGNAWGHNLPGRVEEIRVWSGAMSDSDQVGNLIGE
ncbi:LamG domain-containing protein, partial [Nonomuraea sp. NPDC049784]|uniref:LamG domain-containing protein n=1 Tax=Nonomuraea sp. NPDC049784 TaxID=3154361 RepID=UPI0034004CE2